MTLIVEDAGEPFRVEYVSRLFKLTGQDSGTEAVGDRKVHWALEPNGTVSVTHAPAGAEEPVTYPIPLVFTRLPSGGSRWWWACPACGSRVGVLYLPAGRDRLACRECCGLKYGSQYGRPKVRRKKLVSFVIERERRVWTAATGCVVRSHTRVRRRC